MQTFVPDEMPPRAAYRLMLSSIVPRPIAWVSTLGPDGIPNLAPYSFFNGISGKPLIIMLAIAQKSDRFGGGIKDTLYNLQATGEFVINIVDLTLAEAMNQTAGEWPYTTDEFAVADLQAAPSLDVRPPRVAGARVAMETRLHQIVPVSGSTTTIVLGRIVRFHVRADLLRADGLVDAARLEPLARLGGAEYAALGDIFTLERPRVEPED
ncbi:MAG: flavin reductase family protein [Anaerolineae bacterium]|nr:flavin reductase family protein [Anaerolineae bacterium]